MSEKQLEIIRKYFSIYEDDFLSTIEIENWTDGGVDMILNIDKNEDAIKQLEDYVDNFDIDEEIELYRQSKDYRDHFTIRQSLEDFEEWLNYVKVVIEKLKEVQNGNN